MKPDSLCFPLLLKVGSNVLFKSLLKNFFSWAHKMNLLLASDKNGVIYSQYLLLQNCIDQNVPVRVIRGHESRSSYCGKVYTYDGLYQVPRLFSERGCIICESDSFCCGTSNLHCLKHYRVLILDKRKHTGPFSHAPACLCTQNAS